jgi:myo-inositol-1-phosphate synthase
MAVAGWDLLAGCMAEAVARQGVLSEGQWRPLESRLSQVEVLAAPQGGPCRQQVERIVGDIQALRARHPGHRAVLVDLLPAAPKWTPTIGGSLDELLDAPDPNMPRDMAYAAAAALCGVPWVNFTPNEVELPALVREAEARGVPMAGRDGKTGQTYLKVVLASALRARRLTVDGWYSVNILGNADGRNLSDPAAAEAKLANKTRVLEDVLGYAVGERYGEPTHGVHIAYYPPRGDAKEAWDVVDFRGLFGLPMSLRLNLLARDSILAAPLVLDLAVWTAALQRAGRGGLVPELAFYFKRPLGEAPPLSFQDQVARLDALRGECGSVRGGA